MPSSIVPGEKCNHLVMNTCLLNMQSNVLNIMSISTIYFTFKILSQPSRAAKFVHWEGDELLHKLCRCSRAMRVGEQDSLVLAPGSEKASRRSFFTC